MSSSDITNADPAGDEFQEQGTVPESFVSQVKQALEHLYDFPFLERHALASVGEQTAGHSSETAGQQLRRELMAAIETMSPGPGIPFRSPRGRLYNLLHLHYVEGMTIQETANELYISLRQAYRDLRRGEESVAAVLWKHRAESTPKGNNVEDSSLQTEMARLETHPRPLELLKLLEYAEKAVERLAMRRQVHFHHSLPSDPVTISTDPVVAQQVLVNAFSYAVQQSRPGILNVELEAGKGRIHCTLKYAVDPSNASAPGIQAVVAQLAERLNWRVVQEDHPEGTRAVVLDLTSFGRTLLVIDDNEGLAQLLERYLAGYTCRVIGTTSGQEGLQLAQELLPSAIVLDVMMPGMDGWELLQILRTRPQTAHIPVMICSVFNDPELAFSLGASYFLPKPINRASVLAACHQLALL
jgi:CheY-like chemotaxis protein